MAVSAGDVVERARDQLLAAAGHKVDRYVASGLARYPHVTEGGRWVTTDDGWWSGGLWTGQLWWLWRITGEGRYREAAARFLGPLVGRKDAARVDFDLGFLYRYGFCLAHDLTGSPAYRDVAVAAADRLLGLAHPRNGLLTHVYGHRVARHGEGTVSSIIDAMMNLGLLWWAHARTGEARYRDAAARHARTSLAWLVRADGSTTQVVDFDPVTGERLRLDTHQGVSADSCWTRGQAWAIHGFLQAYQATGDDTFLDAFRRTLAYWAAAVGPDGVPPWDFQAPPASRHVRESSAAAVVLAALVAARHAKVDHPWAVLEARTWAGLAACLAAPDADGILGAGCFHFHRGEGVNAATTWGDYFLLEALAADAPSPDRT